MIQKKHLLGLILLPSLLLCSCSFDLGTFEKDDGYESYYNALGPVKGLYDNGEGAEASKTYDVRDSLFNKYTINDLKWEKDEYKVEEKQYVYLTINFQEELKVQSVALYFKSEDAVKVDISSFYFLSEEAAPKKIKFLNSPSTDHGEPIVYDDPPTVDSIASTRISLTSNKWKDFTLSGFHQGAYEDNYLHTNKGGYLYIRIENNSGLNKPTMTPFSFTFLNLLIRAVE